MLDLDNEFAHQVPINALNRYINGDAQVVLATCGKRWAPSCFTEVHQSRCPECFPKPYFRFAIAA